MRLLRTLAEWFVWVAGVLLMLPIAAAIVRVLSEAISRLPQW